MVPLFMQTPTGASMDHQEWTARFRKMSAIANRVSAARGRRARKACAEAGLDPNLLGIHPNNAMVSYHAGNPWRDIDYSKVRLCLRILRTQYEAARIVTRWDRRVRAIPEACAMPRKYLYLERQILERVPDADDMALVEIEELMRLSKEMKEAEQKGEELGLNRDEYAFYAALASNKSAREVMGDEQLAQ